MGLALGKSKDSTVGTKRLFASVCAWHARDARTFTERGIG
jgi:hypothetical protein